MSLQSDGDRQTNNYIPWCMCNKRVATWCGRPATVGTSMFVRRRSDMGWKSGMDLQTRWCLVGYLQLNILISYSVWFVCCLLLLLRLSSWFITVIDEFLEAKINNNFYVGFLLSSHIHKPSWTSKTWEDKGIRQELILSYRWDRI